MRKRSLTFLPSLFLVRILVQTDRPYLSPHSLRGKQPAKPQPTVTPSRLSSRPAFGEIACDAGLLPAAVIICYDDPHQQFQHDGGAIMVLTPSTMLPLGTTAPDFSLSNVDGSTVSLTDFAGHPALVVIFMCNHCPYVKHVAAGVAQLARDYQARGVAVVGISSNDAAGYPATTRLKKLPKPIAPPARPISSCSTGTRSWPTAARWTPAVPTPASQ
jgi:thiol-disulfide isomerase/thioredoxin